MGICAVAAVDVTAAVDTAFIDVGNVADGAVINALSLIDRLNSRF